MVQGKGKVGGEWGGRADTGPPRQGPPAFLSLLLPACLPPTQEARTTRTRTTRICSHFSPGETPSGVALLARENPYIFTQVQFPAATHLGLNKNLIHLPCLPSGVNNLSVNDFVGYPCADHNPRQPVCVCACVRVCVWTDGVSSQPTAFSTRRVVTRLLCSLVLLPPRGKTVFPITPPLSSAQFSYSVESNSL